MASSSSGRACTRACDLLRDGETLNSMCQQRSRTGLESRAGGCQCPRACLTVVEQVRWSCAGAARVVQSRKYCYRRVYQGGLMKGDPPVCHPPRPSRLAVPTTYLKLHYPFTTALHHQGGPTTFPTHYVNPDIATCDLSCAYQLCTVPLSDYASFSF